MGVTFAEKSMFRHILIPTDGSAVSNRAVKAGIGLARQLGARVTGYYAIEPMPLHVYEESYSIGGAAIAKALQKYARGIGEAHLEGMAKLAARHGIPFKGVVGEARTPYEGIIQAAMRHKCDVIFMASHGRRGVAAMILGSVTHKVLTLSKLPVLVYR
jgi:nucleotide-binding universal stress UspA family protein